MEKKGAGYILLFCFIGSTMLDKAYAPAALTDPHPPAYPPAYPPPAYDDIIPTAPVMVEQTAVTDKMKKEAARLQSERGRLPDLPDMVTDYTLPPSVPEPIEGEDKPALDLVEFNNKITGEERLRTVSLGNGSLESLMKILKDNKRDISLKSTLQAVNNKDMNSAEAENQAMTNKIDQLETRITFLAAKGIDTSRLVEVLYKKLKPMVEHVKRSCEENTKSHAVMEDAYNSLMRRILSHAFMKHFIEETNDITAETKTEDLEKKFAEIDTTPLINTTPLPPLVPGEIGLRDVVERLTPKFGVEGYKDIVEEELLDQQDRLNRLDRLRQTRKYNMMTLQRTQPEEAKRLCTTLGLEEMDVEAEAKRLCTTLGLEVEAEYPAPEAERRAMRAMEDVTARVTARRKNMERDLKDMEDDDLKDMEDNENIRKQVIEQRQALQAVIEQQQELQALIQLANADHAPGHTPAPVHGGGGHAPGIGGDAPGHGGGRRNNNDLTAMTKSDLTAMDLTAMTKKQFQDAVSDPQTLKRVIKTMDTNIKDPADYSFGMRVILNSSKLSKGKIDVKVPGYEKFPPESLGPHTIASLLQGKATS